MDILILYWVLAAFCWGYALRYGGPAGRVAFALFLGAMVATYLTTAAGGLMGSLGEVWRGTNMPLLLTDAAYFLGLYALALRTRVHWTIWAAGLQLMCTLTHFGPLIDPYSDPKLYRALETVWMLPMLLTMVIGIAKDRRAQRNGTFAHDTALRH